MPFKRKSKNEKVRVFGLMFSVLFLLLTFSLFVFRSANAQVPPPTTTCTTGNPEFHSLRPYQASPCQTMLSPTAKFCGNTLTLQDKIDVTYQPGIDDCSRHSGGKVTCNYVKPISETITINLSGAKLPIMGNTENVPNSQSPTGSPPALTDADKVNGYVSWYLNGVMNRAEDGSSKGGDSNIVNFSGPLNKLLPSAIADAQRIQTIKNVAAKTNHNQIVVCAKEGGNNFIGSVQDFFGIGKSNPVQCYAGNNTPAQNDVYQLESWKGGLSWWNNIANSITRVENAAANLFPLIPRDIIDNSIGNHWNKKTPPLPWSDENGKPFASQDLYQKAYNEWRGKTCVIIPVVNKVVCVDNIFVPNKYADLYAYIPLSSTEDTKGSVQIDSVSVGGPSITNISFSNQTPSTLFFPHLTESDQLGSALQKTYLAQDAAETGSDTAVEPPESCSTVDVRSNAGDKLFATQLSGVLGYTASFSCEFDAPSCASQPASSGNFCRSEFGGTCVPGGLTCSSNFGRQDCRSGYTCGLGCTCKQEPQTCTKTVNIGLSTSTSVPKINAIWSRLVGGPTAIVKRLFPQLGTQIGTLKDMPGTTSITYTGAAASSGQLNLPHVGGISEYFLKGIQTLLRPKGYGEPISFGPTSAKTLAGECDGTVFEKFSPPSQTTTKSKTIFNSTILPKLTPELVTVYKEAEKQTGLPCEVFAGLHYVEGLSDPNRSLISGRTLGTPEPDEGNRVFTTLLDTAVYVAGKIKGKVGGQINTWQDIVTALSRYNGGGNRNCRTGVPYLASGSCPPLYEGEDDMYVLDLIDQKHLNMYRIYCADRVLCNPPQPWTDPGVLTVATDFYLEKK